MSISTIIILLGSVVAGWLVIPAFATNATEIFSRKETQPDNSVQAA
jgi:hypothetical protein